MDRHLKRFFWLVPVVVVMACSLLAARATTVAIEARFFAADPVRKAAKPARPKAAAAPVEPLSKESGELVTRNIFCSTCEPAKEAPPPTPVATPVSPGGPVMTALPLVLSATMVADDPRASAATLINTATLRTGTFGPGDAIFDAGVVVEIRPKYVDFRNAQTQRLERVELTAVGSAPSTTTPATTPAVPPPVASTPPSNDQNAEAEFLAEVERGVKKLDDTHFEIDRAIVDKVTANPTLVSRASRIVPSIQGGKANGIKMYAIRPNSFYARLGLQNGDTISSVNGFEITSMDKALEVMSKVRSSSSLSVAITRRGQPVTVEYTIR